MAHRSGHLDPMNVIRAARLVAPVMVKQKAGVIIDISTAWAFEPSAYVPHFGGVPGGNVLVVLPRRSSPDQVRRRTTFA